MSWQVGGMLLCGTIVLVAIICALVEGYRKHATWRALRKRAWREVAYDPRCSQSRFYRIHSRG